MTVKLLNSNGGIQNKTDAKELRLKEMVLILQIPQKKEL
jgi:hypothetical protein